MNKTVNANIGGTVFHIDEDAYFKLYNYLELLKKHFATTEGGDEIIQDIEARIAEMLIEKNKQKDIVNIADAQDVISRMGMPEDIEIAEESTLNSYENYQRQSDKRFFRNPDEKILGGVCGGMGAYFNIDPLWFRLFFVILTLLSFGTGILIYIILWLIIPEAKTTAEKLQMRGENVNISNIEKSFKENMNKFNTRINEFADEAKNFHKSERFQRAKKSSDRAADDLKSFLQNIGEYALKAIGIILVIVGLAIIISFFMAAVGVSSVYSISYPILLQYFFENESHFILSTVGLILLVAVPVLWIITLLIISLAKSNVKRRYIHLSFLGAWFAGLIISIIVIYQIAFDFRVSGVHHQSVTFPYQNDTLYVDMKELNFYDISNANISTINLGNSIFINDTIILKDIELHITEHNSENIELTTVYSARGANRIKSKTRASQIQYGYSFQDSIIFLDPNYSIGNNVWRNQYVRIQIKVPANTTVIKNNEATRVSSNSLTIY